MARTKKNQAKEEVAKEDQRVAVPAPKRLWNKSKKEPADEESSAAPATKKARKQPKKR